jgi:hypothetical protein
MRKGKDEMRAPIRKSGSIKICYDCYHELYPNGKIIFDDVHVHKYHSQLIVIPQSLNRYILSEYTQKGFGPLFTQFTRDKDWF